ncbi:hypothetical protein B5S32_g3441 [[Candida] boidinii]|nr:hypothetical protein B5S29_g1261 [[Candida] boidinii]OWB79227.1 hypothetical protein B5S32_g3441 [[Candida] boidinii]
MDQIIDNLIESVKELNFFKILSNLEKLLLLLIFKISIYIKIIKIELLNYLPILNHFDKFHQDYIINNLKKFEISRHLIEVNGSYYITIIFVYLFIILSIYEIVLYLGIWLNLWKHPASDVFIETPTHVAHVYCNLNIFEYEKDFASQDDKDLIYLFTKLNKNERNSKLLLKVPLKYHFEFSPDEYKDEEKGTDLNFLRNKILNWFNDSKTYKEIFNENKQIYNDKLTLKNVYIYNSKGFLINSEKFDEEFLCDLDINTGETLNCIIKAEAI